jgi:Tfp pilus assembly ATPase PilU
MSSGEYDMKDLLTLVESEHAEGLSLHPGQPPVVHLKGEPHTVEGPPITPENADSLFRTLADTRRVREFRSGGSIEFVHTFRSSRFRVQARAEHDAVYLDLRRLKAQPDAGPNDEERDDV